MEVRIPDVTSFRRAVDALRDFMPQAELRISREGIRINGMDVAHVGFVDFFLSAKDCEAIKVPATNSNIGIAMSILGRVLAMCAPQEPLTLAESGDRLKVQFKSEGRSSQFELPTLHIQEDLVELPDLAYTAVVRVKSAEVSGLIKDLGIFGDDVWLKLDDEGFHLTVKGDSGEGHVALEPTEEREMTLDGDDPVEVEFSMKYMQQIIKHASSMAAYMEISFDSDKPLQVKTRFGKESHFIAYLAPKISED